MKHQWCFTSLVPLEATCGSRSTTRCCFSFFLFFRCKPVSDSRWNPYGRLPADVCGINCMLESSLRFDSCDASLWNKCLESSLHLHFHLLHSSECCNVLQNLMVISTIYDLLLLVRSSRVRISWIYIFFSSCLLEGNQAGQDRNHTMREATWPWWPAACAWRRLSPCWSLQFFSAWSPCTSTSLQRMIYMTVSTML